VIFGKDGEQVATSHFIASIWPAFAAKPCGMHIRMLLLPFLFVPSPALAKVTYPVPVPQECVELAQREGVPLMIETRYQAIKARYKLARLSGRDPLVRQCREAVARAKKAEQ
jgi:hypothetical protein